jgi:uncharacterized protein involved in exopolysaccharide biosynthesis
MERQELVLQRGSGAVSWTMRDFVAMGFRRRRPLLVCFFGLLLATIVFAVFFPSYRAETEILLHRERVDPVTTAQQTTPLLVTNEITESEVNSEVELVKSRDVLRPVVIKTGLDQLIHPWFRSKTPEQKIDAAVESLRNSLVVEALPKSNMVQVQYSSGKPEMAGLVLQELDNSYIAWHREIHYPTGQFEFFDKETKRASDRLQTAEDKLRAFPGKIGVANPTVARDLTLQKLTESNYDLAGTREAIAEASHRIDTLRQLQKSTPARLTTQMRDADAEGILQQMKSTLLALQLRQSDMSSKYQPDYPPLVEVNKEVAETQTAINNEKMVKDVTTDQNPAYVWIDGELAKAQADLHGYQAKANETEAMIKETMESARQMDVNSIEQADLVRAAKAAEDDYLLYLKKREEARIGEALDQTRLLNVSIAEKAMVPSVPALSPMLIGLFGVMLAFAASAGLVFTLERMDTSFRTPAEVEAVLNLPLLAAVPEAGGYRLHLESRNGNGNGNGNGGSQNPSGPGDNGAYAEDGVDQNVRPSA